MFFGNLRLYYIYCYTCFAVMFEVLGEFLIGFIEVAVKIAFKATGAVIRWVAGRCGKKYTDLYHQDTATSSLVGFGFFALVTNGLLIRLL